MCRYLSGRNLPPLVRSAGHLIPTGGLLALLFGGTLTTTGGWRPDAIVALLTIGIIGTEAASRLLC